MNIFGLTLLAIGLFSICGAVFDWDWFMLSRKGQRMVDRLGRSRARRLYGLMGFAMSVFGGLVTLGLVEVQDSSKSPSQTAMPSAPIAEPSPVLPPVPDGAVEIRVVSPLQPEELSKVVDRLMKLKLSRSIKSQINNGVAQITLRDNANAEAVAARIDFGEVVKVDAEERRIEVRVDAEKLAALTPPPDAKPEPSKSGFTFSFGQTPDAQEATPPRAKPIDPLVETTVAGVVFPFKQTVSINGRMVAFTMCRRFQDKR